MPWNRFTLALPREGDRDCVAGGRARRGCSIAFSVPDRQAAVPTFDEFILKPTDCAQDGCSAST
jgi:hypothetical protein